MLTIIGSAGGNVGPVSTFFQSGSSVLQKRQQRSSLQGRHRQGTADEGTHTGRGVLRTHIWVAVQASVQADVGGRTSHYSLL